MSVESLMERKQDGQRKLSTEAVSQKLYQLEQAFHEEQDEVNAEKTSQLNRKWNMGEFVLAFCGHFSAGKSTMINTLMGKEILPSSPIPTSANVVKVKSGEAKAIAYFKDRDPAVFDYVKDLDQVKELCKDGDEVVSMDIFHPNDFLVNGACLLDTPGIDSTDTAHKVATESAIHLADVVVYMMDYNHVQSEVNFQFTKTMKEKGKRLYLVINQIDKHFDLELNFSDFKQGVKEAFLQWGVEPEAIFYTTLKIPNHPENQLEQLHDQLYSLFWNKEQVLQQSVLRSALDLIEDHERFIKARNKKEKEILEMKIGDENNKEEIESAYTSLQENLQEIQKRPHQLRDEVVKEFQSVIENANITPFSMRDLAGKYLESREPGFKVGFLFSAGKTKQEKEERLKLFHDEVQEQVKANLEWHVREILQRVPKAYQLSIPSELQQEIDHFHFPITPELLASQAKEGARVTGDAILNYSRDLAAEIKSRLKRSGMNLIEEFVKISEKEGKEEQILLSEKSKGIETKMTAIKELSSLEEKEFKYITDLKNELLNEKEGMAEATYLEEEFKFPVSRNWKEKSSGSIVKKEKVDSLELERETKPISAFKQDFRDKLITSADSLRKAAHSIEGLRGQSLAARHMIQRADRLEQNLFTVALFGAFSAGKSSFANAMMGEMILPVSPNPTTATINKILPPTAEFPHGSVRVKMKNLQDMTKDVLQSLQIFRLRANTIEEAVDQLNSVDVDHILPSAKPHYSFLRAVKHGLGQMQKQLGQEFLVGMKEFKELVAKEDKACFVEWIELYYSCPLTDQGISLVDTPGADSINARHTGVAFDYIKNADAVLFVTYYNHAFSHADREFLQQLGRVKDTFEMDKMFFLVNAADLARSKDELIGVVDHVKENLLACGIRQPRLYPVSSQTALLARMYAAGHLSDSAEQVYRERTGSQDHLMSPEEALAFSGFEVFERDFIQFTIEELTQVAIQSAKGEIRRSIYTIQSLIDTAKEGEEQRKLKLIKAQESRKTDVELISSQPFERENEQLKKESEELLYYVKQRLFFRYNELFTLSFNPAVIKEENGKDQKLILQQCLDELMRNIVFTLLQEMRATSLRLEKKGENLISEIFQEIRAKLKAQVELSYQEIHWGIPEIYEELDYEQTSAKRILNQFKSPKHFFEQEGREGMRQQLENWVNPIVSQYMDQCMNQMQQYYSTAFENSILEIREQFLEQLDEHYDGLLGALDEKIDVNHLESILYRLESLV